MSPDRDTHDPRPDSDPDDDVYAENEEGDPRYAGRTPDNEGVYGGYPEHATRLADPKVYGALLLFGAVLFLFPEPITSALGFLLLVVGAFVGLVDVFGG